MTVSEFPASAKRTATQVNEDMGRQIKTLRLVFGWSQEELARRIDVSFQQIQKYESGTNAVSLFRLEQICDAFGVDWSHFLDPKPETVDPLVFAPRHRTTIEMLEAFEAIGNGSHRRTLINLAEALADKQ